VKKRLGRRDREAARQLPVRKIVAILCVIGCPPAAEIAIQNGSAARRLLVPP